MNFIVMAISFFCHYQVALQLDVTAVELIVEAEHVDAGDHLKGAAKVTCPDPGHNFSGLYYNVITIVNSNSIIVGQ